MDRVTASDDALCLRRVKAHCRDALRALERGERAEASAHLQYAELLVQGLPPQHILGLQSALRAAERS